MKLICSIALIVMNLCVVKAQKPGSNDTPKQQTKRVDLTETRQDYKIGFIGNFYLAPQRWSSLGADSELGFGLGGTIGLGLRTGKMVLGVGPHFGFNRWQTDFFQSPATNAFIDLYDIGIEGDFKVILDKTKLGIILGTGATQFDTGYLSGNPNINQGLTRAEEKYTNLGIGVNLGKLEIAPVYVMYTGVAKDASRLELRIGIVF